MASTRSQPRRGSDDVHFDHLETRVDRLDERLDLFGTQLNGVSRVVEGMNARLDGWGDSIKRLTAEKPSPWPNLIAGISVLLSVGVLAITPVAWLAVKSDAVGMKQTAEIARLEAQVKILLADRVANDPRIPNPERTD